MEISTGLELSAILVTLFFFLLTSVLDVRSREVDDRVWLVYGPIGLVLTIAATLLEPSRLLFTVVAIVVSVAFAVGLFYFGFFGGADAKAIMCLGLTIPIVPHSYLTLLGYAQPVFPIVVVITGYICSASAAVWYGCKNLVSYLRVGPKFFQGVEHESRWRKALAMVSGYPADVSRLRSVFYLYPMEEITERPEGVQRKFRLLFNVEEDRNKAVSDFCDTYSRLGLRGNVWVTPGLPMLVFITIGLVLTLILGDLVFSTVLLLAAH
jgi:preflagellin peptidase FlaK